VLANKAAQAHWTKNSDADTRDRQVGATVAALVGIAPKDELHDGGAIDRRPQRFNGMILSRHDRRSDFRGLSA
jgi:hypothetical protein